MTLDTRNPRDTATPEEAAEERRLWAEYYEAAAHALKIVRAGPTAGAARSEIFADDARAAAAMRRIKEIRGIRD